MKKLLISVLVVAILLLSFPTAVLAAEPVNKPITPPELKNITFIHYAKPDKPGKPPSEPEGNYKLIGLYVDGNMTYYVNTSGSPNGSLIALISSFDTWESAVSKDLFTYNGPTSASGSRRDGQNIISWARIAPRNIIAITNMWYYNDGNPATLDPIAEFDIVFNSFLSWGIDIDGEGTDYVLTGAYDVKNIATHEVGHVVGLDDLYDDSNSYLTMYGYGSKGETQKISLADGDIQGAKLIYNTP